VHRIGRTARMGSFGKAILFVMRDQGKQLTEIEMLINKELTRHEVEGFESSPEPADRFSAGPRPSAPSRYETPVPAGQAAAGVQTTPARSKRLGSKFKPSRRRRL
jgi:superfamily II DNA/RNA helicase